MRLSLCTWVLCLYLFCRIVKWIAIIRIWFKFKTVICRISTQTTLTWFLSHYASITSGVRLFDRLILFLSIGSKRLLNLTMYAEICFAESELTLDSSPYSVIIHEICQRNIVNQPRKSVWIVRVLTSLDKICKRTNSKRLIRRGSLLTL